MKKFCWLRLSALLLCFSILLAAPAAAASREISGYTVTIAQGTELTRRISWTGRDYTEENYLELSSGSPVTPTVVSFDTLCTMGSMASAEALLASRGLRPVAAVNGGFYEPSSGIPVGAVLQNGILRSDPDGMYVLGFGPEGAVMGLTGLKMTVSISGTAYILQHYNKALADGFALYSSDFAPTTKSGQKALYAVCSMDGEMRMGSVANLTVEDVFESDGAVNIPGGKYVLALSQSASDYSKNAFAQITVGSEISVALDCDDGWEGIDSGVGILYPMITDGAVVPELSSSADPRTAVGIRADGSLVIYTCDGRRSGHSVGISLADAAVLLLDMGCVQAGALDGGGSTNLRAVMPGDDAMSQVNTPSDGRQRSVVNYLFLTLPDDSVGDKCMLSISPYMINALAGAHLPLTLKATDGLGRSAVISGQPQFSVTGDMGIVEDGLFTALREGEGLINASMDGAESVSIPVRVVETPDEIKLYGEVYGKLINSLTLESGQEVDLTATAKLDHVPLTGSDELFTWSLDSMAGTVDGSGHITAAGDAGTGDLTVSAGDFSVSVPITALSPIPFRDVDRGDWYYEAVKYCYRNNIFAGTSTDIFDPGVAMNRAMLVTVLWRLSGSPTHVQLCSFEDVDTESWYGTAVSWAQENGVVYGYSPEEFRPLDDLTHEQVAAIVHRWAGSPEADEIVLELWQDSAEISAYARSAMAWAATPGQSLVGGYAETHLAPAAPATRAETADVLMRLLEMSA